MIFVVMAKRKYTELGHYRLTDRQAKDFVKAAELKGCKPAPKVRELIVDFTESTLAEHRILTGNKK